MARRWEDGVELREMVLRSYLKADSRRLFEVQIGGAVWLRETGCVAHGRREGVTVFRRFLEGGTTVSEETRYRKISGTI